MVPLRMVTAEEREALEAPVKAACSADEHGIATRRALELYGPEILGYLVARTHDADLANDAFSSFCECLWRGLPDFRWESSLRTWAYVVARNALRAILRKPEHRRPATPLTDSVINGIVAKVRSTTAIYLRTEAKDAVARLRRELDPLDQDILVLRIGRRMSWIDIARVVHDGDQEPEGPSLKRNAARLRKRFERSKAALEDLVRKEGLCPESLG